MATDDSYVKMYSAFRSRGNYYEVFQETINRLRRELNLGSVKSCLMIGPGEGIHEVPFIKQCAANISKLIAIEPDHQSVEGLRVRLDKDLPGVDCQVIETDIQSWKGLDNPVDLVLMMSVLFYIPPSDRHELFKKLQEQWLTTDGFVIVVSPSRTKCPGNANQIFERLGASHTAWEDIDIETEFLEAGFIKKYAHEMQGMRDYSDPDEPFLRFFQHRINRPSVTLDDVRNAMKELFPNGKSDQVFHTLAVFGRC